MNDGFAELPVFSLPGDGSDVSPQVEAASSIYPYYEKVLYAIALLALLAASAVPLLEALPGEGPFGYFMTIVFIVLIGGVSVFGLAWPFIGERCIWRVRGWVAVVTEHAHGRLGRIVDIHMTGLRLYDGHIEWGGPGWRERSSASYEHVAWSAFYGDLLIVSLGMAPRYPPEAVADVSGLNAAQREEVARFIEERVNAARRTRAYRRMVSPDTWATDLSGRIIWGIWRCVLDVAAALCILLGLLCLGGVAEGEFDSGIVSATCFSMFFLVGGISLFVGLGGRSLCFLRRHPTRRHFRVGTVKRRHPVSPEMVQSELEAESKGGAL